MPPIRVSRKLFSKFRSIQAAIDAAPIGSVIEIEPGVYKEDLWINKYIELVGIGPREQVIIQGSEHAALEMATDYAVVKNLTIYQSKKSKASSVVITKGSLVLDGCEVKSGIGSSVSIVGNEAEPVFRRCLFYSSQNVAVLNRSRGKILFEECQLSSHSDVAVVLIADGNPVFRHCTMTGNPGYGIFVEENGRGTFEECNLYGFDHSPAVGINGGNPSFFRCKIHDGQESGIAIHRGKGLFEECILFGFGKELPAIRVSNRSHPRFQHCTIKDCKGGAFLFEQECSGIVENCDMYGFIYRPAIIIRSEAHPQFLRSRIHDGNKEGIVSYDSGKGVMESCEIYSFNSDLITVSQSGKLDMLRCKIFNGNRYGIYMAQKAEGIIKDTEIYDVERKSAVYVTQAADPLFVHCQISNSLIGVQIQENGRGTFEQCTFKNIKHAVWDIHESQPIIRHCKDEHDQETEAPVNDNDAIAFSEPIHRLFSKLNEVIGQREVKETLREVILYLDYLQERKQMGFKTTEAINIHALFTGPNDTGKRYVAELYGQIMKEMGFLEKGHIVSASVTDLVGEDPERTESKWKQWVQQAQGGILYLSQIHTLTAGLWPMPSIHYLYNQIKHLLTKTQPECAMILVGPEQPMKQWLKSHPQISDHLKHQYRFSEYTPEEMVLIFESVAREEDYTIHPSAVSTLLKEMRALWGRQEGTSCAVKVKEYFQKVKVAHSRRCSKLPKGERTREMLTTFLTEDLNVKESAQIQPGNEAWLKELGKY